MDDIRPMNSLPQNPIPPATVVVAAYRDAQRLQRLLASLDELDGPDGFEVIIVDDCSPDNTEAVVREWLQRPAPCLKRYIRLAQNSGPARARNAGLRQARASIVAFTDSDCVASPRWLRALVACVGEEARIAGAGGTVLPLNERGLISRFNTFFGVLEPPSNLLYLVTANCCFLREPALAAGGFDETLKQPGGEDIVLSYRLWQQGWRFARADEAVIRHDYRENLRSFYRTWWNYGFGSGYINKAIIEEPSAGDDAGDAPVWTAQVMAPYRGSVRERCIDLWSVFKAGAVRYRSLVTGMGLVFLRMAVWTAYGRGYRQGERSAS